MKSAKKSPTKAGDPLDSFLEHMAKEEKTMEMLRMTDENLLSNVKGWISTQSLSLNKAIGHPGVPRGRLVEISGPEHVGKSTLLDHIFAETQRIGGLAMLVDPEVGRDAKYTRNIGVDPERLIVPQAKEGKHKQKLQGGKGTKDVENFLTLEDVFNTVGRALDWQRLCFPELPMTIGIDSVAALPTREDLERSAGEKKPGEAASVIKHTLRALIQKIAKSGVCLIFVNQLYTRIGYQGWGDPRIEYGGSGIPYHASLRIRLNPAGEKIKTSDGHIIGSVTEALIRKSKVSGVTGAKCDIPILHGVGIDNVYTLFTRFKAEGYIAVGGAGWNSMLLPETQEPLKWQRQHLGLAELCAQTEGLYDKLVAIYMAMPG